MSAPSCSVIVATYNRAGRLRKLLSALEAQDIGTQAFEVIVIDDGSCDETHDVLATLETSLQLKFHSQANQGPAAARNQAIALAESELIVSLDDDVEPAEDLLRRHLEAHEGQDRLAAMGEMLLPLQRELSPWLQWEAMALEKQYQHLRAGDWRATPRQFYTANASFKRRAAIGAGLFDPTFRRAEDIEFAYRLQDQGGSFQFLSKAIVHHDPQRSYTEWLRVPLQYGHYDVIMGRDKGRQNILTHAAWDYSRRPAALKLLAHAFVGRGRLVKAFNATAAATAYVGSALSLHRVSSSAYSAIFNLQYWHGLSEGLGGRKAFWDLVRGRDGQAAPTAAEHQEGMDR
jgi:glycosyltransferase involved in cell wall biosynthesis